MTKAYICHYGTKGMHWGVRHDRRKQSVAKRRAAQKKKVAKKKSIRERAKERIAKVDKQKVKKIAKTTALVLGRVAVAATLGYIGSMGYSELIRLNDELRSTNEEKERIRGIASKAIDARNKLFDAYTDEHIENLELKEELLRRKK